MSDRPHIGLDNPAFRGRLRTSSSFASRHYAPSRPPVRATPRQAYVPPAPRSGTQPKPSTPTVSSAPPIWAAQLQTQQPPPTPRPAPVPQPAPPTANWSTNLEPTSRIKRRPRQQTMLLTMAAIIFVLGLAASLQTFRTNQATASKATAMASQATDGDNPSTAKPSPEEVRGYSVAPDLARYVKIPKIGVNARVLQVGTKANGQLIAPSNVHDAAWYTGSAKPGQPGATLIDGHVSSWSTKGVFYNLKNLTAGDMVRIERGDGKIFNYKVVNSQIYEADKVDMSAAMRSAMPGKSALNLISCTGKVKPGTNDFTHRIIVFAVQVD